MRPANVITTLADVMLGYAVSGMIVNIVDSSNIKFLNSNIHDLSYLILSSACLYTGGVIFNDLIDAEWDIINHPNKPIPSGRANKKVSFLIGVFLTLLGIVSGFIVSYLSGSIALLIAIIAFLHNYFKNHINIGGLILGICRSLNLLLGMSIVYSSIYNYWYLALVPLIYIGAVALLSGSGSFHSGRHSIEGSMLLFSIVLIGIVTMTFLPEFRLVHALPFLILFLLLIFPNLYKALNNPQPEVIQNASKYSIHSLFVLEAAIASGFAGYEYGVLILMLFPFSVVLSRILEEY